MRKLVSALTRLTPIKVSPIVHCHWHGHASPISHSFRPPNLPTCLTFELKALAASIARTEASRRMSDETLYWWKKKAFIEVMLLIENGSDFTLSSDFHLLADAARTSFAGSVGAGISDLIMVDMGYTWRDNAEGLSSARGPRPDFIYDDGPAAGHGMVIVEAHGSFAKKITSAKIERRTRNKLGRQVIPNLTSVHPLYGEAIHGYCVGFGSRPGSKDSFLCVADTFAPATQHRQSSSVNPGSGNPPISLVLATFRANFSLLNATSVVRWIEYILFDIDRPKDTFSVEFHIVRYAGIEFVILLDFLPFFFLQSTDVFGIMKQVCQVFLNCLTHIINGEEETSIEFSEIPKSEIAGFSSTELRDTEYVRYRDGLVFLENINTSKIEWRGKLVWDPFSGCEVK